MGDQGEVDEIDDDEEGSYSKVHVTKVLEYEIESGVKSWKSQPSNRMLLTPKKSNT